MRRLKKDMCSRFVMVKKKNYFAQESHLGYGLAMAYKASGNRPEYERALESAMIDHAAPTEISYFRARAFYEADRISEARALCEEMIASGKKKIREKDINSYYGVGSPCPCPFEYNFPKINTVKGLVLIAFGELGLDASRKQKRTLQRLRRWMLQILRSLCLKKFCK